MPDEKNDLGTNIEKLQQLSGLFQPRQPAQTTEIGDLLSAVEKAKKLQTLLHLLQPPKAEITISKAPETNPFLPPKEMKIINAALPYLDQNNQKTLYLLLKLLEIRQIQTMPNILESQSAEKSARRKESREMLIAVKPYLNQKEQNEVDIILKLIEMKKLMESMKGDSYGP